jgi:hypothetical protein
VLKKVDTNIPICYKAGLASGNNSVVECNLAKVEVASSNLVSRSKKYMGQVKYLALILWGFTAFIHYLRTPQKNNSTLN